MLSRGLRPAFLQKALRVYFGGKTIPWAIPFGESEVNIMLNQAMNVPNWYNNMQNPVST
ncbi:hypothetical protein [Desulfosporosinus acididurans]|uniref:hypothetical protein n=1 Tax=Desulfosporosinus acididurans TaxID=476652 RepID=UPI000B2F96EB|nr:hypothetical protein [Desulfosporosinus acididurans]